MIKLGCLQSAGCEMMKLKMFVVMCNLENIISDVTYFLFSPLQEIKKSVAGIFRFQKWFDANHQTDVSLQVIIYT